VLRLKFLKTELKINAPWKEGAPLTTIKKLIGAKTRLVGGTRFVKDCVLDPSQVELLANASLRGLDECKKVVVGWQRQGQSLADIYLNGIAPCTRLLGCQWASDELSFVDCHLANAKLQQLLYEFSDEFLSEGNGAKTEGSVLLMTEPGSQHGLGVFMLSEFFKQAGWQVTLAHPQDLRAFSDLLTSDWFDAIGLSISTDRHLELLSQTWPHMRRGVANPEALFFVGGPMAALAPEKLNWPGALVFDLDAQKTVASLMTHMGRFD